MSPILELPEELQVAIVQALYEIDLPSLINVGLSCQRFRRLSSQYQWEQVFLTWRLNKQAPIIKFFDIHHGNTNVRCIRLHPQRSIMNAIRIEMPNSYHHVPALRRCLSSLVNLTTFSIYLHGHADRRCYLPGSVISSIVRSLPPSLANLELDTQGVDRKWETPPITEDADHLCSAIGERIANLQTLHLRLSSLCSCLYSDLSRSTSPSNLRRAYIRLDFEHSDPHHLEVPTVMTNCNNSWPQRLALHERRPQDSIATDQLIQKSYELRRSGRFPHLERFLYYTWREIDDGHHTARSLRVVDMAGGTETLFPCAEVSCDGDVIARLLPDDDYSQLYLTRDHDGQCYFGNTKDIERAVLDEVEWSESSTGTRVPPMGNIRSPDVSLETSQLISATDLWKLQDIVKVELQDVEPVFGHPRRFMPTEAALKGRDVQVIRLR